ncbi:MAG: hypothetical protein GEU83_15100 [Pseudonocardiaceae bacterium]|nr:hypothetical protein [Pseudonocardiaceae bacterium]
MNPGVAAIAGMALIVGLWLYWHRDAPKFTTFLFLIAGTGIGGYLGQLLGQALNTVLGTVGTQTGQWVGIGASTLTAGVALVATLEIVIKGLYKKKAKPQRWHPWLALALPTIIFAAGFPFLVQIMEAFETGVTTVGNSVSGIGG